jgi:uncharacterized UPF0160 family protein
MNDTNNKKTKRIITHSGNFHADEVFACAVLSILNEGNVEIVRSRDPEVWATGDYVVDVGGVYDHAVGRYDHHQIGGAGAHENGIPYSSLGLVWKHYGELVSGTPEASQIITKRLVDPIDAVDNGVETFNVLGVAAPYLIQDAIVAFRPGWNEARTEDEGFFEAFEVATKILKREIILAQGKTEGEAKARAAYDAAEDKRIIVLEGNYPSFEVLAEHSEPIYVVKPERGNSGQWKVGTIRAESHTFKNRKDLPQAWAGKQGKELAEISGVPDATFCHNKLFVAGAGSKEGAIALAKKALEA